MVELGSAAAGNVGHVAAVLADAFNDDPVFSWLFPELESRPRLLQALFTFLAEGIYVPFSTSTMTDESAALWQPPGRSVDESFWTQHGERFFTALEGQIERLTAVSGQMDAHHPHEDHWYLPAIGVRPSAQGRGLGAAHLAHTLGLADAEGHGAYLEASSPRSRALYARHGFEVVAEFTVDDSPPIWPMWREPR